MSLPHAILGLLAEQPLTGYELKTMWFDRAIAHFWAADHTQIYRTLDKLAEQGLVTVTVEHQPDRPTRKVYQLSDAGRVELDAWLHTLQPSAPVRDALQVQLFCGTTLTNAALAALLQAERSTQVRRRDVYRERLKQAEAGAATSRAKLLRLLTLQRGIGRAEEAVAWLDTALATVATLPDEPVNGTPAGHNDELQ